MTLGPNNQCSTNELATSERTPEMWLWALPAFRQRQLLLRKEVIQRPHGACATHARPDGRGCRTAKPVNGWNW